MKFSVFSAAICFGLAATSLAMAQPVAGPRPQMTVQDLQRQLAAPRPDCEARGLVSDPDGTCEPKVGDERGFSLAAPAPAGQARPSAAGGKRPPARPAARQARATVRPPAAVPPTTGVDLLITFANGSSTLTEQARANAAVFAEALNTPQLQAMRFEIDGHTDAVGGRAYNIALSRARAAALVDFVVARGVDRKRLVAHGYGFDRPADPADPRAPENRRVEARRLN